MPAETGDTRERGSIAILALWGVALIFMLLAPVALATRGDIQIARNALAASRARLAAEAGTQLGIVRLLRRHAAGTATFDGTPESWQQGTTRVAIAIQDEAGKVDINVAPLELLAGLFVGAGVPREAAGLIACNIIERRGDSAPSCPDSDTPRASYRFSATEELAQLPGIDERLYDRVADCVTVVTGASAIDPMVAPRGVLMAIPGATDGLVDEFIQARRTLHDFGAAGAGLVPAGLAAFLMSSPGREFTVAATARTADGARYRAELLIRLAPGAAQPYQILGWRAPPADRGGVPPPKPRVSP